MKLVYQETCLSMFCMECLYIYVLKHSKELPKYIKIHTFIPSVVASNG